MKNKGIPKRDGSGKGVRANYGRGGCGASKDEVSPVIGIIVLLVFFALVAVASYCTGDARLVMPN